MTPIAARPAASAPPDGGASARGRANASDATGVGFADVLGAAAMAADAEPAHRDGRRSDDGLVAESSPSAAPGEASSPTSPPVVADTATHLHDWSAWLLWQGGPAPEETAAPHPDVDTGLGEAEVALDADGQAPAGAAVAPGPAGVPFGVGVGVDAPATFAPQSGQADQHDGAAQARVPAHAGTPDPSSAAVAPSPRPGMAAPTTPPTTTPSPAGVDEPGAAAPDALAPPPEPTAAGDASAVGGNPVLIGRGEPVAHATASLPPQAVRHADPRPSGEASVLDAADFEAHTSSAHDAASAESGASHDAQHSRQDAPAAVARVEPAVSFAPDAPGIALPGAHRAADVADVAAPLEPAPRGEMASTVVDQVVKSLRMQWRQGLGEARIQLRPEHLGPVDISLKVEAGSVTAVVRAESAQVQEWILANQQSLRQQLEAAGLRLSDLVVSPDAERRRQQGDEPPPERRPASRRRRDDGAEPIFNVVV